MLDLGGAGPIELDARVPRSIATWHRHVDLLGRRRVELVDEDLPAIPHHHEGQLLRLSAERHAVLALDAVTSGVPDILAITLRTCPQLPATVAERITNYRARSLAHQELRRSLSPITRDSRAAME